MKQIYQQVEKYLAYCEQVRNMSETTMQAKRNVLGRFARVIDEMGLGSLGEVTNEIFNRWVGVERARGISARSMNTYNSAVIALLKYHRGTGMEIPLNLALVARLKEEPARREFYTAEEVGRVLAVAQASGDVQTGLMIQLMFETGMRIAELARLKLADFEVGADGLIGRRMLFVSKGRKLREAYVTTETLALLRQFIAQYGVTQHLWHAFDGGSLDDDVPPLTTQTVRNRLKRVFCMAGFPDFYPHALRHSFATDLQLRGASVAEIKEMIGHSSVATTERYLHGFEGQLRELFDKYH